MNERFMRFGLSIDSSASRTLQEPCLRNPEAINMVYRTLVEILCGSASRVADTDSSQQ